MPAWAQERTKGIGLRDPPDALPAAEKAGSLAGAGRGAAAELEGKERTQEPNSQERQPAGRDGRALCPATARQNTIAEPPPPQKITERSAPPLCLQRPQEAEPPRRRAGRQRRGRRQPGRAPAPGQAQWRAPRASGASRAWAQTSRCAPVTAEQERGKEGASPLASCRPGAARGLVGGGAGAYGAPLWNVQSGAARLQPAPLCQRSVSSSSARRAAPPQEAAVAWGHAPRACPPGPYLPRTWQVVFMHGGNAYELGLFSTREEGIRVADVLASEQSEGGRRAGAQPGGGWGYEERSAGRRGGRRRRAAQAFCAGAPVQASCRPTGLLCLGAAWDTGQPASAAARCPPAHASHPPANLPRPPTRHGLTLCYPSFPHAAVKEAVDAGRDLSELQLEYPLDRWALGGCGRQFRRKEL